MIPPSLNIAISRVRGRTVPGGSGCSDRIPPPPEGRAGSVRVQLAASPATIFRCGLSVVAWLAERLQVPLGKEQRLVTVVWGNVVNDSSGG